MLLRFIQIYCLVGYSFFFFHLSLAIWGRQTVLDSRWVFLDMSPFWDCTTYKNFIKNDFINIIIWPGGIWDLPWPGMEAVHPVEGAWSLNYFPRGSVVKNPPASVRDVKFDPWIGNIPWRRKWQPIPLFLPRKSHRQRILEGSIGSKRVDMPEHAVLYFRLGNSVDRGAWPATVRGVAKSEGTQWLNNNNEESP